ncbi:MAG: YajQ family cyclic di-GMP-binding protein [Eggerthellaceae bacterium]|nr:YajQ family cyclic di-GMP-binding protein [Eggerthellaceae bacterium]
MTKESSFDVVSIVDMQEVDNAYTQTKKELLQRYDLKGSGASINLDKQAKTMTVHAPSDFIARQVIDVLSSKLVKRGIDLKAFKWGDPQAATGQSVRLIAQIINGIDKDTATKINKDIKAEKFKVRVQIEGEQLRVFSASKDSLQEVIAFLKEMDYGQPLQYQNYRG